MKMIEFLAKFVEMTNGSVYTIPYGFYAGTKTIPEKAS